MRSWQINTPEPIAIAVDPGNAIAVDPGNAIAVDSCSSDERDVIRVPSSFAVNDERDLKLERLGPSDRDLLVG